uniref:Uncharacterized protein n=1 Tax=Rhizophora mucronata TaxID=61149 RepID=A0A2P2PPC0_RHIMU
MCRIGVNKWSMKFWRNCVANNCQSLFDIAAGDKAF